MKEDKKFIPDEDLLGLAKDFSERYTTLSAGEYFSDKRNYHIRYCEEIRDVVTGGVLSTNARISHKTGIIELDKTKFSSYKINPDYVFFAILWCVGMRLFDNRAESDIKVLQYYLTTGRSHKNLVFGVFELFGQNPSMLNHERLGRIEKYILEFEQK